MKTFNTNKFKCPECEQSYYLLKHLVNHLYYQHGINRIDQENKIKVEVK